jgi:PIN domain nuclease of toxin-antitoxin system
MSLLLDTHTFIWYYNGAKELSPVAKRLITDSKGDFYVSIISLWEITIKVGLGKLDLEKPLDEFIKDFAFQGYQILPINLSNLLIYGSLPHHHKDPFDRLIISQGISENMDILSKDMIFDDYLTDTKIKRIW